MDVQPVLIDYLGEIKHIAPGSQRFYQMHLSVFADYCIEASVCLEQVNNRTVQGFLLWLKINRKPKKAGKWESSVWLAEVGKDGSPATVFETGCHCPLE